MFLFGKGKINKLIEDLNKRYNTLKDSNLDTKMAKLKLISINNVEYKELYTIIESNYNTLINEYYMDIESSITRLEAIKATTDLKILKAEIKSINDKLDKACNEQEEIANQMWGDRFQVVVATHLDREHLHNHFIINSVSMVDGKRYYDTRTSYAEFRRLCNQICKEHNLSYMEEKKTKSTQKANPTRKKKSNGSK